ncbi:hypothetical protein COHA_010306 [Chlorella ohadii]|uniref:Uncharacterized protein n=1 Tax=Chlorella ohadii TaxID=2649997 RepID=A0AAD5DGK9_9CHLO|nr:hypothetical protein COHA_010306 [Chlorella ohadii]
MPLPVLNGWAKRWRAWRDSPFRRATNEAAADADRTLWHVGSIVLLVLLVFKTVAQERLVVLALQNATHLMLQQGLALMIARRRETYVRFRELWVLAATAHLVWICLNSAFHGGTNSLELASGSPLLLLPLLLIGNTGLWVALYMLHARLLHPVNLAALPLLALPALACTSRLCGRMLAIPALREPMGPAFAALDWLALVPLSPAPLSPPVTDGTSQCIILNVWALLVFAVAVPLHILGRLERRARRLFWASRVEELCTEQCGRPTPEAKAEAIRLLYVPCATAAELLLFAVLAWQAARTAVVLLRGGSP